MLATTPLGNSGTSFFVSSGHLPDGASSVCLDGPDAVEVVFIGGWVPR